MESRLVELDRDHPGFRDLRYRERRDAIAHLANTHRPGTLVRDVQYTAEEAGVWSACMDALAPLHDRYACHSYLEGWPLLGFEKGRICQLAEAGERLKQRTGFDYEPVAGLVTPRLFMERLADRLFLATQYMRHHSAPLYTPEPDVIHELLGHAPLLANARYAELNARFGVATRAVDDSRIDGLIRLYWYVLEFGVVKSAKGLKAIGAGLLSSFGELGRFEKSAKLSPLDTEVVARTPFDPTQYQHTLFVAESEEAALAAVHRYLDGCTS